MAKHNNTLLFLLVSSLLILPTFLEANGNHHHHKKKHHSPPYDGYDYDLEFGDLRFSVGSLGWSGSYGSSYGRPSGSCSWSGVQRGWTVYKNKGRCYKRKLKCPNKCFHKWSTSGGTILEQMFKTHSSSGAWSFNVKKLKICCTLF